MRDELNKEQELIQILKLVAPGTALREGLENILKAHTGALIVVSDSPEVLKLTDGGFKIDDEYSSAKIYELAKMDGAIILSKDAKRILLANTQLIPDAGINTMETGTRHRSGERVAKQTNELVISISQRRSLITLYKGDIKYVVQESGKVLTKANQALQTVEKYKTIFDDAVHTLNEFEFDDIVTLENVVTTLQRAELCMRVVSEVNRYIIELGEDGRLVEMQLTELSKDIESEEKLLIRDYLISDRDVSDVIEQISILSHTGLMDKNLIGKLLGFTIEGSLDNVEVSTKGYRLLTKIPKTPINIIDNMLKKFGDFQHIIRASIEELDDVDGIGEVRAQNIKQGIKRMHEQAIYDSKFYR